MCIFRSQFPYGIQKTPVLLSLNGEMNLKDLEISHLVKQFMGAVFLRSDQLTLKFKINVASNPNTALTRGTEGKRSTCQSMSVVNIIRENVCHGQGTDKQ